MAVLTDVTTAGLLAATVFLVVLGLLVVFAESIRLAAVAAILVLVLALSALLVVGGELGLALVVLAFGGAVIGSQIFEWLTMR